MRIARIRLVLPARLRPEAVALARQAGREIAVAVGSGEPSGAVIGVTVEGGGRPAPMLARAAAGAVGAAVASRKT